VGCAPLARSRALFPRAFTGISARYGDRNTSADLRPGFRGEDAARRPWVIGSGLDIWEIIQMLDDLGSIGRLTEETQLTERHARLAVAYRDSYPEEIVEAIAQNQRTAAEWHELYPFIELSPAS
jgi:hypothetical protein